MPDAGAVRAGKAFVEFFADDSKLTKGLRAIQSRISLAGNQIAGLGARISGAGSVIWTPLLAAAKIFADYGTELHYLSERTGIAVDQLGGLAYAAKYSDTSLEDLAIGFKKMQKVIGEAAQKNAHGSLLKNLQLQESKSALAQIGVTLDDLRGLTPDEQFLLFADRIAAIQDPAMKTAAALSIFGKNGTALLPMLNRGSAGLREMFGSGFKVTAEDANNALRMHNALLKLGSVTKGLTMSIGKAVSPMFSSGFEWLSKAIPKYRGLIEANKGLISTVGAAAGIVTGVGAAVIGLGATLKFAAIAMGPLISGLTLFGKIGGFAITMTARLSTIMMTSLVTVFRVALASIVSAAASLWGWITSAISATAANLSLAASEAAALGPLTLLGLGLAVLAGTLIYVSGIMGRTANYFSAAFSKMWSDGQMAFQGISDALASGNLELAGRVAWTGLKLVWAEGINALLTTWYDFQRTLSDTFNNAGSYLARGWVAAVYGIKTVFVSLIDFLDEAWTGFTSWFLQKWSSAVNAFARPIAKLMAWWEGLDEAEVMAELNAVQAAEKSQQAAETETRTKALKARSDSRQADLMRFNEDYSTQKNSIEKERGAREAANAKQFEGQVDGMRAEEAILRRELTDLRKRAADPKKSELEKRLEAGFPDPGALGSLTAEKRSFAVAGTFSASAVAGLGAGSAADRTAKATELTARHTKKLAEQPAPFLYFGM